MKELFLNLYSNIEAFILSIGYFGILVTMLCIVVESIIPIVPVALFFALSCMILGKISGLIVAYIATIIGCMLSYILVSSIFRDKFHHFLSKKKAGRKVLKFVDNASVSSLTVIMAIPFAPAFLVNIAAGLSDKVTKKSFLISLIIGKAFLVYFWGFIGTSLKNSLSDPLIIVKIIIMLLIAYIASHIINRTLGVK